MKCAHGCSSPSGLARLGDGIQQSGLATLHDGNRLLQRRTEIFGITNRSLGVPSHALRKFCEIDIWIDEGSADAGILDAALMPVGHSLDMHRLLMIAAVIVHNVEQRNPVMCG